MMIHSVMDTPAYRALTPLEQALYVWVKRRWKGEERNNNGEITLSTREAATCMKVHHQTVAKAFHGLQQKGFLVVTVQAALGEPGIGRCPRYEITELPLPGKRPNEARKLFKQWSPGNDFPGVGASNETRQPRRKSLPKLRVVGDAE
ncbi:MAG: hypothetical protein AAF484_09500 [Pseudomonadota bacterium]